MDRDNRMKTFIFPNPSIIIFYMLYFGFIIFAFTMTLLVLSDTPMNTGLSIVGGITLLSGISCYFLIFDRKISIDSTGVHHKSLRRVLFLRWEDIKEVGFVELRASSRSQGYKFVCFSTFENGTGKQVSELSKDNIYLRDRRGLINFIKEYWKKDIIPFDQKDYDKYVRY
ncbi:hypothetical protein [Paenibacillus sp. 1P07SE]|uniref:hypothetical protein n=1 Tax=Paenibacillus sp. 1P07SE TaxID=3132209 RepID=UPI0039A4C0DB